MKIEVKVHSTAILRLADEELKKVGVDPNKFKMKHNQSVKGGERGEGNLSYILFTFED